MPAPSGAPPETPSTRHSAATASAHPPHTLERHEAAAALARAEDIEVKAGWGCLERALLRPLATLARNAGKNGDYIVEKLLGLREGPTDWLGWDALQDEFRDFGADTTIIDPCKVAITVIESAASATSTLMTAEASITDAP